MSMTCQIFEDVLRDVKQGHSVYADKAYANEEKEERLDTLDQFLDDLRIPMDKNQSERDLRHAPIGRKNWNFAGDMWAPRAWRHFSP